MIFSDQNFLPTLCGKHSCISISRLEDGSLTEITSLAIEVLERQKVPIGSLILLGSASHLHNVGTTIFAIDWNNCVAELLSRIKNVKILPLVPILREDGPGSLGRQLIEIRTWYGKIYEKNTLGIIPVWDKLVKTLTETDEDGLDLGYSEVYCVALPTSLEPGSPLEPVKFYTSSSHTTVRSFDSMASHELIRTLVDLLQSKFATDANSEDLLFREPAEQESGGKDPKKFIVIGGSNLSKTVTHLVSNGLTVLDLTVRGWTPTAENIQKACDSLKTVPNLVDYVIIFDVLGNITFRQEQLDGTLALPHKVNGVHHLSGTVHVCSHSTLKTIIKSLKPILDIITGCDFLFLSPIPRHLFNGCCLDPEHCVGADTKEYVESLLKDVLSLRAVCKNALLELGLKRFWVPDLIGNLLPACNGLSEQAAGLREIAAADGVHFTKHGYEKLAHTILCCSKSLVEKSNTAKNSVSDAGGSNSSHRGGPKSFYWRGFVSPIGSERPRNHQARFMLTHQGSGGGGKWNRGQNRDRGGHNRPPPYYQRF
jgi:hypothetical protein